MPKYTVSDGVSAAVVDAGNIEEAMGLAKEWLEGVYSVHPGYPKTVWVDATVTCGDETARVTVQFDPPVPICTQGGHMWIKGSVIGHGPGVVVRELCKCGVWRVTDTWAQRPDTGEQGLERVWYEPADTGSLYRIAKVSNPFLVEDVVSDIEVMQWYFDIGKVIRSLNWHICAANMVRRKNALDSAVAGGKPAAEVMDCYRLLAAAVGPDVTKALLQSDDVFPEVNHSGGASPPVGGKVLLYVDRAGVAVVADTTAEWGSAAIFSTVGG